MQPFRIDTIEDVARDVALRLRLQAEALQAEAGKWLELSDILTDTDNPATFESILAGLLARDPGRWSSVWGDLETLAKHKAKRGRA